MLYSYKKATPDNPSPGHKIPKQIRFLPTIVSAIGFALITSVVWPILGYHFSALFNLSSQNLLSPLHYTSLADGSNNGPIILSNVDYTEAGNWFETNNTPIFNTNTSITEYNISIPSLGILSAKVSLIDEDLSQHLVHYPQTALPGQKGSPVIFGHSTLPQFFNPQDYSTIFSNLPDIKIGDEININYDNIKYLYQVIRIYEVKPADVYVLRQDYNQSTLKLITCVPPGTKLKRLVVESNLVKK